MNPVGVAGTLETNIISLGQIAIFGPDGAGHTNRLPSQTRFFTGFPYCFFTGFTDSGGPKRPSETFNGNI